MVKDDLGTRMKEYYEQPSKTRLVRRMPVILRVDGRSFHTFLKGFKKPFDTLFTSCMQNTAKYLCENIQGCVLSYQQSDEISLLLVDYGDLNTSAWFDYEVQKLSSVTASMATMAFNRDFARRVEKESNRYYKAWNVSEEEKKYLDTLQKAVETGAMFDARCFNLPREEVTNYFYWRQLDAARNSVQMAGHAYFSQKEMHGKNNSEIQDMLMLEKEINWNDYPSLLKRGSCCVKEVIPVIGKDEQMLNCRLWKFDNEIPVFKGEGRQYIERLVYPELQKEEQKETAPDKSGDMMKTDENMALENTEMEDLDK